MHHAAALFALAVFSPLAAQARPSPSPSPVEVAAARCDPSAAGPSNPRAVTLAGWTVTVDTGTGAWSVTPPSGGAPIMSSPGTCVAEEGEARPAVRVAVGEPFSYRAFGAWRTSLTGSRADAQWSEPTGAAPQASLSAARATLTWPLDGGMGTATLTFAPYGGRDLRVSLTASSPDASAGEVAFSCGASDAFFGLGSQVTGMDLRGHTYPLWTQEQGIGKFPHGGLWPLNNTVEAAYAPMGI